VEDVPGRGGNRVNAGAPPEGQLGRPPAAYLPARHGRKPLEAGIRCRVKDAPTFAHSFWVIWRSDIEPAVQAVAARTLSEAVARAEEGMAAVVEQL
jgi:LysR family transcriptional regulator, flagellar master operon regulator